MLILARNKVDSEQLKNVITPAATETHTPIGHALLAERTRNVIAKAGFEITEEEHAIARGGLRYFGGFALKGGTIDGDDRKLVLGLRNAHDKSFAASVCIGNQMMVCEARSPSHSQYPSGSQHGAFVCCQSRDFALE